MQFKGLQTIVTLSNKFRILNKYLGNFFWYISLCEYHRLRKLSPLKSFKFMQQTPIWRSIYQILSYRPLNKIIKYFDKNIIFNGDSIIESYLKSIHPQLVLYPGSAMDSYSHIVSRTAEKSNIPTVMVISHWDFFSKKSILRFNPSKIYVWGEDMKKSALLDQNINKNLIEIVGSPNLDKYKHWTFYDRSLALSSFGIPTNTKVILFAGTSVPYDEVSVLQRINSYLEENHIQNILIIYRPHPRGWVRKTSATVSPANMKFVKIDTPKSINFSSQDHYINLLSAVDGIVSPFSTMILEGALCGKQVLCISFADTVNEFDFSITNISDHLENIKIQSWATVCDKSENLEKFFSQYLVKIDTIKDQENIDIKNIIHYDHRPYSKRLSSFISKDFFNK